MADETSIESLDRRHLLHPYSSLTAGDQVHVVEHAEGVRLHLSNGRVIVDGMSSWWAAIHGYNHPRLRQAALDQLNDFSHVMFGGLTHQPAARLGQQLLEVADPSLEVIFYCDSGSVSVEVAVKMALQYWTSQGRPQKDTIATVNGGYHGDTMGVIALCDPGNGMHKAFNFRPFPTLFCGLPPAESVSVQDAIDRLEAALKRSADSIAAFVIEPIVQNAGGLHFYSPAYLKAARQLCDEYEVLLITDEIATGFGRTGKMFACEHAGVAPDIQCVGKALSGGMVSLAATMTTRKIAEGISGTDNRPFMHGPTYMGNPLACAIAAENIALLRSYNWHATIQDLQSWLRIGLEPCRALSQVADVRVLGAIGVVQTVDPVDTAVLQSRFVDAGVWVRPFRDLIYITPPYISTQADIELLTAAIGDVVANDL